MRKLLASLALLLPMATTSFAQEMSASGEIVSVRLLTRTMNVRDAASDEAIRYDVPMSAAVTLAGQPGRLGYLRAGDSVDLRYINRDRGREATAVRLPQPTPNMDARVADGPMSTITGRVERLDHRSRVMTVLGDLSGEAFTYAVPEGTRITVAGESARFGQLQRGDNVVLRFKDDAGQRQAARVRVPEPVAPLAQRRDQTPPGGLVAQQPRTQLPRTAGSLPLLAAFGLLSLCAAGGLSLTRRLRRAA